MAGHDPLVEKLTFLVSQIAIGKINWLMENEVIEWKRNRGA